MPVDGVHHFLGQFHCALAAFQEGFVHGEAHLQILTVLAHNVNLLVSVEVESVKRHYDGLPESLHVVDVAVQVLQTFLQSLRVRLLDVLKPHTTMHLQALCGCNNYHQTWLQAGLPALYVEEFLATKVGAEASLCHHIVAIAHGHLRGEHTATAVGYVGKRSAMDKCRGVLCCLNEVRVDGISQQYGDGTGHAEVFYAEVLAVGSNAQHYVLNTPLQVFLARGQAENGHQLRGGSNVETRFADHAVASQASHHIAQGAVVHVKHALPVDLAQREAVLAVLEDVIV